MINARVGTVDISPIELCVMGCGDYKLPSRECRDALEANYILLENGESKTVLISLDLLYVGPQLRAELVNRMSKQFGPDEIFLAASHTHYAPMVDETKEMMGEVNQQYVERIAGLISTEIQESLEKEPQEILLRHGDYEFSNVVSRRRRRFLGMKNGKFHLNKFVMLPNFSVKSFPKSHVILILSDNEVIAVLWQFSCHPTSLPIGNAHSAHYVDAVRTRLRKDFGREIPLIFLQGFSGDLRPPAYNLNPKTILGQIEKIVLGPRFRSFTENEYDFWSESVCSDFMFQVEKLLSIGTSRTEPLARKILTKRLTWPLGDFFEDRDLSPRVFSLHKFEFDGVIILGASAELISNWSSHFSALGGNKPVIGVSCIDDTYGYLPDRETLLEGGYEGGDFCKPFGLPPLSPNLEYLFLERLRKFSEE